jgi:tRNA/rRNA methyltransferase
VPIGPNIIDFVSFPLRTVIDLIPQDENVAAAKTRLDRRAWLIERGYRVIDVRAVDVEADVAKLLDALNAAVSKPPSGEV